MKNTYKNHVSIVLDRSSSMSGIIDTAVQVFNTQIETLRLKSLKYEQETRVSFYTFSHEVDCVISDVDVARPMVLDKVQANGMTAMLDAIGLAIDDSKLISQKYGDHSFFIYCITDGEENRSNKYSPSMFRTLLRDLPDNYTVAAFVPNSAGIDALAGYGVPRGCLEIWDTTKKGLIEVGEKFDKTMDNYFESRKKGIRGSATVFSDLKEVTSKNVTQVLTKVKPSSYDILINEAVKAVQIRDLVESKTNIQYHKGIAYYELVKNEFVQPTKSIMIQNKKNGMVYEGDTARQLLNLPDREVKVVPGDFGEWIVYVQSTSVNRNVIPKQRILVKK